MKAFDNGLMTAWDTLKRFLIRLTMIYYWKRWALLIPQITLLVGTNPTFLIVCFNVNLENCYSDPSNITCGVPQESILGPLQFLIYVNDIPKTVKSNLLLYADNSCLVFQGKDVIRFEKQLNRDCTNYLQMMCR